MKRKIGTKKKMLTGGFVGNGAQSDPTKNLMEDHRMKAQADLAGASGFIPNFLDTVTPIVGNLASNWGAQQQAGFAKMATPMTDIQTAGFSPQGIKDYFQVPTMASGGIVGDPIKAQKDFLQSYIDSDMYAKRLGRQFTTPEKVSSIQKERSDRLRNTKTKILTDEPLGPMWGSAVGAYYSEGSHPSLEMVGKSNTSGQNISLSKLKPGSIYLESASRDKGWTPQEGFFTTPSHEYGHAATGGGKDMPLSMVASVANRVNGVGRMPSYDENGDKDYTKPNWKMTPHGKYNGVDWTEDREPVIFEYTAMPDEVNARLQSARFLLNENNIYDTRKEDFTEQHLDQMLSIPSILEQQDVLDLFKEMKGSGEYNSSDIEKMKTDPKARENFLWFMNNLAQNGVKTNTMAASGGIFENQVEVEGEERYELPNGMVGEFQGPSHESGGIDVSLPAGTEVYSKRLKGPDGKTMAKRKEMRDNKISKIEKQLSKNPLDALLSKSLARAKQAFEMQDQQDLAVMQQHQQQKFARGGIVGKNLLDMFKDDPVDLGESIVIGSAPQEASAVVQPTSSSTSYNTYTDPTKVGNKKKSLLGLTPGDMLGIAGNITKASQAYKDTLGEISNTIPNVNAYENFGREGLATLKNNQMTMQQLYDLSTQNLRGKTATNTAQSRASARGVNQMRALDVANIQAENQAQAQIDAQYAGQVMQNNNAIAQQQNMIDGAVMRGEAEKRLADQQDLATDAMNLQANRQTMTDALLTQSANVLNKSQQRKLMSGLMSARFGNFEVDEFGNVTGVAEGGVKSVEEQMSDRGLLETYNKAIADGENIEFRNGNLYYKDNNELYKAGDKTAQEKEDSLRDYSDLLERGSGLGLSEGINFSSGKITQGKGYKGSATADGLEPYLKAYSRALGGEDVDLSTKEGVEAMQKKLGIKADGVIGNATKKALEDYFPDATKESKGYNSGLTQKEHAELEKLFKSTDPAVDSAIGRAKEIYGEFSDKDFASDKNLQREITDSIFYGAVDYADTLYKDLVAENKLGDFTREELRKISLISPDAIKFDEEGNLDINLDSRVPGTNHTLGYKVRGTKYTKRFAKRD